MRTIFFLSSLLLSIALLHAQNCNVQESSRIDCGYSGINQEGCEAKGCCWYPDGQGSQTPWCFYKSDQKDVCAQLDFTHSGVSFTEEDIANMKQYFTANLNIQGKGGVVASPDPNTPGGSYYYAWMRDEALSMKTFMILNDFELGSIQYNMNSWVNWVLGRQAESDPNNIDVRIEPKFNLPNGDPYTGGWCRPQTDGPALRATTLVLYANVLIENGQTDYVRQNLWTGSGSYNGGAIKYDLDWVAENWQQNGCDLWEEIRSDDFFWGRMNFRRGLILGADLAEKLGDSSTASYYRNVANTIENAIASHWTGSFIKEEANRQKDSAVISAFNDGYNDDDFFRPTDAKIASTISTLNNLFCHSYPINQLDITNGVPGILYGRYQGDTYAGGNPWFLLTSDLAKVFYRASLSITQAKLNGQSFLSDEVYNAWIQALNLKSNALSKGFLGSYQDLNLAAALLNAGDSVMERVYYHAKDGGFHLTEQIDKNTGKELGAKDLTWSYATTLVALKYRAKAEVALRQFQTA